MLIEFSSIEAAQRYGDTPEWKNILASANKCARKILNITTSNTRRIGPVDHSTNGVFLFNYFYADSLDINLKVSNYTAAIPILYQLA